MSILTKQYHLLTPRKPMELLPASLLPYRRTWQPLIRSLPTSAYLIVTNLDNSPQNASLLRLIRQLRQQGESVYVLSVGDRQPLKPNREKEVAEA